MEPSESPLCEPESEPSSALWRRFTILDIMLLSLIAGINSYLFRGIASRVPVPAILVGTLSTVFWFGPCRILLQFRRGRARRLGFGEQLWIGQALGILALVLLVVLFEAVSEIVPTLPGFYLKIAFSIPASLLFVLLSMLGVFMLAYECVLPVVCLVGLYETFFQAGARDEPDLWTNRIGYVLAPSPHWVILATFVASAVW